MHDIQEYVEPVYHYLRANAGKDDETGTLVTNAPLHPWLVDTYGLTPSQAQRIRTGSVKELEAQGRVRREHPRTTRVWILR